MRVFFVLAAAAAGLTYTGLLDLTWVHDNFLARALQLALKRFAEPSDALCSQALLTAGNAFAVLASLHLYAASFRRGRLLAPGGDTGNAVYDFFIGRELNPRCATKHACSTAFSIMTPRAQIARRIGGIDLKEFCELTPGLIGWLLLDLSFAWKCVLHFLALLQGSGVDC